MNRNGAKNAIKLKNSPQHNSRKGGWRSCARWMRLASVNSSELLFPVASDMLWRGGRTVSSTSAIIGIITKPMTLTVQPKLSWCLCSNWSVMIGQTTPPREDPPTDMPEAIPLFRLKYRGTIPDAGTAMKDMPIARRSPWAFETHDKSVASRR